MARYRLKFARGKMYKVGLTPKPDELIDYDATFGEQTKKIQDVFKSLGYEVETNKVGQKNPQSQIDTAMNVPMSEVLKRVSSILSNQRIAPIDEEIGNINDELRSLSIIMNEYEINDQYRKYSDPKGEVAADKYDQLLDEREKLRNQRGRFFISGDRLLSEKLLNILLDT